MLARLYRLSGTTAELVPRLESASARDERAERRARRYGVGALIAGIGALPSVFVMGPLGVALGYETLAGWVLLSLLGLAVALGLAWGFERLHDVDDRKLQAARRTLRVLAADVPASRPVSLELDLRGYRRGGRLLERQGFLFGQRRRRYAQRWLQLRATLADGSVVVASLTDDVVRKVKPKRKRTKVRERFRSQATLVLRLARRHGPAQPLVEALSRSGPPLGLRRVACTGSGRSLRVVLATPAAVRLRDRSTSERGFEQLGSAKTLLAGLHWIYVAIAARPQAA
jgi:hypothetical protein